MRHTKAILAVFLLLFSFNLVAAIDLSVSSTPVIDTIINDNEVPGEFDIRITNNGDSGEFEIYTFERFELTPSSFNINKDETKTIRAIFLPTGSMRNNVGHINIPYIFKEKLTGDIQEESVVLKLADFEEVFDFNAENVNPDSSSISITFYNIEDIKYDNVNVVFSSPFFEGKQIFVDLNSFEKKKMTFPIDIGEFKKLVAGTYTITATYTADGRTEKMQRPVKILEKSGLSNSESRDGFIIVKDTVEKINEGNIPTVADVSVRKNIISRLFTSFSVEPIRVERNGPYVDYAWQKELQPTESLKVVVTTNWIFPFLLLIAVIIIVYLFKVYVTTKLEIRKKVDFVRTKGGEFALKVSILVRAKEIIENIKIYDRLPGMTKMYEKFGTKPDNVDKTTGRLQWNIPRLGDGEERIFSYIIYSKLKIVGKFELPSAIGIYEIDGKVHESKSNKAFFINEPEERVRVEEEE